jgi:hypothetical protein
MGRGSVKKHIQALAVVASILVVVGASTAPEPSPIPRSAGRPDAASIEARTGAPEATSFSDTSAFLLGSGLALLIALLAWGEQIRAITRDTRDLERDFLQATGLTRAQLSALLQARNDDDRLIAFNNLMASGKLTSASQVEILPLFERWRSLGTELRSLQSRKYWLTIALTVVFLGTGMLAALAPGRLVSLPLLLVFPGILVFILLVTVVSAGRVEQRLNALLMQIAEKV